MRKQKVKCTLPGFEKIPGFDGYYINTDGQVYSEFQGRMMKTFNRGGKYVSVTLQQGKTAKMYLLHRLVAITFLPNPNNYPEIDHIDGNPENNRLENLRWVTKKTKSKQPYISAKKKSSYY